ncbi:MULTISPECIES: methyl-accepting chemotaxis protein [Pseudoalteromonas]|uniref:Methyl-accepting chemotaxis protein n=1 Tax=Pseudoalteromonas obscura TaxID=3048491 RepID=A0ABT7EMS2_9GAMM|nr:MULTISPECIES: methyl-accepting chemotaxis protein [Pseudoalteromonas]MBQ4838788.1 methyl-accepting chemotaxis protein [Pseudoalteromonas luteoviolacea]MDK2596347.1 methyl-accepting chemotaxis protein [Pseudoalteromonas sp. P94(2023)]
MNLTVSQRIWGGFIIITLLLLLIGVNSLLRIANIDSSTQLVNNLSLPALDRSAALQIEFTQMSKIAQASYFTQSSSDLNNLKTTFNTRQSTFEKSYSALNQVVRDEPTLYGSSKDVSASFGSFSKSVTALFADKSLELSLNKQLIAQLEEAEIAADDAATVVVDILDLEGFESLNARAYQAANKLENSFSSLATSSADILTINESSTLDIVKKEQSYVFEDIDRNLDLMRSTVAQLDEDLLNDLDSYYNALKEQLQGSDSIANNRQKLITARISTQNELNNAEQATKKALDQLGALVAQSKQLAFEIQNEVTEDVSSANIATWTGMIAATLLAIGIAYFTVSRITKPLAEVNRVLDIVAKGDMTHSLDASAKDEFGELAQSCNTLITSLKELITGIVSRSTQLAAASEQTSAITAESSQAIKSQQSQVEQAATATTEMSSTAHGVSNSAHQALEEIKNADQEAERVKGISHDNKRTIEQLAHEVEEVSTVINKLHQDSSAIGGILDVIRGIAEQTNLLALNAAIEAARAGEQGRGFAVVADEVRSLASKTQESTQEIQSMIESLQAGAEEAVTAMSKGQQQAESCVSQSDIANEALNCITDAVSRAHDVSEEIATAANEQQQVSQEISERLESIVAIAEQTAEGANQTSTSSSEVAKLAEELRQSVSQFRV